MPDAVEPGFALVATLAMLPLMAIVAVGIMSLSAVELRKSSIHQAQLEAQANARVALMIALGELQKSLGPDQRVTADSRMLSTNPSSLKQPHWVNVWRTTNEDGSPYIRRNAEEGGLADSRSEGGWTAELERLTTLVSGNEAGFVYFDGSVPQVPDGEEMIELVGEGSVGSHERTDRVSAPEVPLTKDGKLRGSYAWWVGDLGTKANISTRDASERSEAKLAELRPLLLAQDASLSGQPDHAELADSVRGRLTTTSQLALDSGDPDSTRKLFHDLTTDSVGLLVDVREGGLKKDLTAYLESSGKINDLREGDTVSFGVQDRDRLVGPRNGNVDAASADPAQAARFSEVAPSFGLLRDWAARARNAAFGDYRASADYAQLSRTSTNSRNQSPVEFKNRLKGDLTPVLVEGSIYYNLSYYVPQNADARSPYGLRVHLYPRVALWNPYNFELTVEPSMIYLHINGNKNIEVTMQNNMRQGYKMYWGLSGGSQRGSLFFKMNGAKIAPGETLVWSPQANRAYDETTFSSNVLSSDVAPSPSRGFYQDSRSDGTPLFQVQQSFPPKPNLVNNRLPAAPREWREAVPTRPGGDVQSGGYTQADDYLMMWKPLKGNNGPINLAAFGKLPQGRFVSCAYQYGDEDEMPVEWSSIDPVPFPQSSMDSPTVPDTPDRRTRDGFRLRWFDEHASNRIGSGSLAGTAHLECSPIANWNMRASYSFRNPFENVTDVAPNFFGIYTRDLFDGAVDWNEMSPRFASGSYKGDPFGQPLRSTMPRILFDVPRSGAEIASIGAFQHACFSEFIWHPTYALGNSLADPRIDLTRTEPRRSNRLNSEKGGWNQDTIGYALDGRSNPNGNSASTREDNWSWHARALLQHSAIDQNLIYDLSYELNHGLWDEFFLSTGSRAERAAFVKDPEGAPLPNGRMKLHAGAAESDILDFHRAASALAIDGAFNVNSTSVSAWEAMLLSSVGAQFGSDVVTFPRILGSRGGEWDGKDPRSDNAWTGQRSLSRTEVRRLAEEIVMEVKSRGPFLSLADFVNRRLRDDVTGRSGTLQAAIDRAGLNQGFESEWPLDNRTALPSYSHVDHIKEPTRMDQTLKPGTTAWGALGFLTQADILQFLGPALSARSDTFVIRAYGSSRNMMGQVMAEAWCEAVVQRTAEPMNPDSLGLNPERSGERIDFGRRFEVVRFRWLNRAEV